MINRFFDIIGSFKTRIFKCLVFCFCLISISLFANNGKSKNKSKERDTTVLPHQEAYNLAGIRFKEDSLFTPEQMREDLLFYYDKVLKTHPNPYHVISKDSLEKKIVGILNSLDKPLNRRLFWLKIATLNACFDAHTDIMKLGELYDYFWANSKPKISRNQALDLVMVDALGNLYFNPEYNDSALAGKHIKSINNIPANQLFEKFSTYYSHENRTILPKLFAMNFFLLYANTSGKVDSFKFEYINNDNTIDVQTFYPVETPKNIASSTQTKQETEEKNIRLNLYEEYSMAIIELNTFSPEKLGENFRKDLETMMATVIEKNIKHLFIDISRNGGGYSTCAVEILNFIKTQKKKYYDGSTENKISPAYRALLIKNNSIINKELNAPDGSIIKQDYHWTKNNAKIQYNQNFYLIQGFPTASASISLSSLVKFYKMGIIIGEETSGLTGGYSNVVCFAMPNTSIPFMCSTKKVLDIGGAMDGRGVLPDVEYKISNPYKSFTLEQLKEMLELVEEYKKKVVEP